MISNYYTSCESTLSTNQVSFSSVKQNNTQNMWFTLYDLADRTNCVGRVTHLVDSSLTMLGWVSCTSSSNVLTFTFNNPNPANPSISYRYYRFTPKRIRDVTAGDRQYQLSEFQFFLDSTRKTASSVSVSSGGSNPVSNINDNNLNTYWISTTPWSPITFDMGASPPSVNSYRFAGYRDGTNSYQSSRDPIAWIIEGRDCTTCMWNLLDERSGTEIVPSGTISTPSYTVKFPFRSSQALNPYVLTPQYYYNGNMAGIATTKIRTKYFRYFKFSGLVLRTPGHGYQISEIQLLYQGQLQSLASTSTAKTPDGTLSGQGASEAAVKVVDDNVGSKWYTSTEIATLLIDIGSIKPVDSYRFATGGDIPERDPMEWTLKGSNNDLAYSTSWNDDSVWTLLDASYGQRVDGVPTKRNTFTSVIPFTYNLGSSPLLGWYK
jgi:hypothetical protein